MPRPSLTPSTSPEDFQRYYWLKAEMLAFCRQNELPVTGSKIEISHRIVQFLSGEACSILQPSAKKGAARMPETFTRETCIGHNWRCSEALRAFFLQEIGPQFHFNALMRDFIKNGAGKTLQEAIEAWQKFHENPSEPAPIAPQFEYNRHIRKFFQENPGKTLQDAIQAWNEQKSRPKP